MNKLSMNERETIVGLLRSGWSERLGEALTGRPFAAVESRPGSSRQNVPAIPKCPPTKNRPPSPKWPPIPASRAAPESSRPFIVAECDKGRNATAIYQDLVEHHAYDGAYDAVKRFVRTLRKDEPKISCRFETAPGADYVEYCVIIC